MTRQTPPTGAALIRATVRILDACPEAWTCDYTAAELCAIAAAYLAASWDYLPHTWEPRQVREAIAGVVPRWSADGTEAEYASDVEVTEPDPQSADLDAKIDEYAQIILTTMDSDGAVKLASTLDVLLRYREDRERRAHVARTGGTAR